MSFYEFLVTVHVLFAILWVGGGATLHIMIRRAFKDPDRQRAHAAMSEAEAIGGRFYPAFGMLLLIAGILLVTRKEGGFEFSDTFIQIGLTGWVLSFLIGVAYYPREGKKREELVAAEGVNGPNVLASLKRTTNVNAFELAILLVVIVSMTTKPGWP